MKSLQEALTEWNKEQCRCEGRHPHEVEVKQQEFDPQKGGLVSLGEMKPKPDKDVCVRERKWREYCSIRDGKVYNVH